MVHAPDRVKIRRQLRQRRRESVARLTLRLGLAAAVIALALTSATAARADLLPGLLGGNCGTTSQVFAQWGDFASYYFPSNGGFESGAAGWSLPSGSHVVADNEPFRVHGSRDTYSLAVPAGDSVTTPPLCYGVLYPSIRFFAKSTSGENGTIQVRVKVRSLLGVLTILDGGRLTVGQEWSPTQVHLQLGAALASLVGAKTMQVELVPSTGVQIDDFYVDPFLQRG
jgi:hypothetical protein